MFPYAENAEHVSKIRNYKTTDIVKRIGVLPPNKIKIKNYFGLSPSTAFNPAMFVRKNHVYVYPRVILGYYKYISCILRIEIPLEELYYLSDNGCVQGEVVIYPDTNYDFWGTEDPRVCEINGRTFMVYVGRSIRYFDSNTRKDKTFPVVSEARDKEGTGWSKKVVLTVEKMFREELISDKDASFADTGSDEVLVFHRPHMMNGNMYLTAGRINIQDLDNVDGIKEVEIRDTRVMFEPAKFETKLGWASPPLRIKKNEYLAFVHGVDRTGVYRVFAALIRNDENLGLHVTSVTPEYIMEPRTLYERLGDRPYVTFPCGVVQVDDSVLLSYGAADHCVGFGEISLDEILHILDKHRFD